jgi:predicted ferric reductase
MSADVRTTASEPPSMHVVAPIVALVFVAAVLLSGATSQTAWYVVRGTGVIAYLLVTLSVVVGLLMSNRMASPGRTRVDLYEIHSFAALLGLAFASVHGLALLLDTYIGFSPMQLIVPFTSSYRPLAVAFGMVAFYLSAMVYGSLWLRPHIGYRAWRTLHYASFLAFVGASLHGMMSGTDTSTLWMFAIYAGSIGVVTFLLFYRVLGGAQQAPRARTA